MFNTLLIHCSCTFDITITSQIEDNTLSLELSVFDPRPVVEQLVQKYKVHARHKDVSMSLTIDLSYSNFVIDQHNCIRLLGGLHFATNLKGSIYSVSIHRHMIHRHIARTLL